VGRGRAWWVIPFGLVTVEPGWSQQTYEEWLASLAETELLGPG
jgi:hypothetical protein